MPARPTRRRLLLGAAAVVGAAAALGATGCDPRPPARPGRSATPSVPSAAPAPGRGDPLVALIAAERTLLARYDATARRHPTLRARLAGARADHLAHLRALTAALGATAAPSAPPGPVGVPPRPAAALTALVSAERAAAIRLGRACLTADAARAVLLGSIAASEASHPVVLR